MTQLGNQTPDATAGRHLRLIWIVLLPLFIVMVGGYWHHSLNKHRQQAAADFEQSVAQSVEMLQERFTLYETILFAGRALFHSSEVVGEGEWRHFVESMEVAESFPGILYLAFAQGYPLASDTGEIRISHIEPASRFAYLHGVELAHYPQVMRAAEEAAARHATVFSQSLVETKFHANPLVYQLLPVYRHDLEHASNSERGEAQLGWVVAAYDIHDWFDRFTSQLENDHYHFEIYEGANTKEALYRSVEGKEVAASDYSLRRTLQLPGTEWALRFFSTTDFDAAHSATPLHLFALSAMIAVLTIWLLVYWLLGSRERAVVLAESMLLQLSRSEQRYRQLFEHNNAVQLLIDPQDGHIVDANEAAANYYGYSRDELQRKHLDQINILSREQIAKEMAAACEERRNHFHFRHRLASGEVRDVEVHSGPLELEGKSMLYSIVHDVTARMASERALRESEARYHTIIDITDEGYWLIDLDRFTIVDVNAALGRMLGYQHEEMIGHPPSDFIAEDHWARLEQQEGGIASEEQRQYEVVLRHRDGHKIAVEVHATNMPDEEGRPRQAFALIRDISERRRTEEQLRIAATFFETTSEAITVTDNRNRIIAVNPAFCQITGYREEEVLGCDPSILSSGRNSTAFYNDMWRTLQRQGRWQGEIWNRRKNGEVFPEWLSIVAIKDEAGTTRQYMAVFSDITKRKQDEAKIWRQANYDGLTTLPNRNLFKDRLDQAMHAAHREGWQLALLFIDLDRFKWVNDTLGHAAGDELLQMAAGRLLACVREMDTVARLGGDEFTVILTDVQEVAEVDRVTERILRHLAEPFLLGGREAFVSASIGITLYPGDCAEMEALLQNADAAMYAAKEAGRNTFSYFTQALNEEAQRRLRLESDLRRVLERGQLAVHYQAIVDRDGSVAGAEALLRWDHPELGRVSPEEFIPLAEEIGVIVDIEQWVMAQACRDAAAFQRASGIRLFVSVNVSSLHCKSDQCRNVLGGLLSLSGLPADCLKLEITERVMMENTEHVVGLLAEVRRMGVRLAVDDFGTGYSSLSYLKQFPVDVLKIDRAFVSGLPGDRDDVALVEAIIVMAHSLGLQVVAEGVENEAQLTFLCEHGCDLIQGYYYSRPLPAAEFVEYLVAPRGDSGSC